MQRLSTPSEDAIVHALNCTRHYFDQYSDEIFDRNNPGFYTRDQMKNLNFYKKCYNDVITLAKELGYYVFIDNNLMELHNTDIVAHEIIDEVRLCLFFLVNRPCLYLFDRVRRWISVTLLSSNSATTVTGRRAV